MGIDEQLIRCRYTGRSGRLSLPAVVCGLVFFLVLMPETGRFEQGAVKGARS